LKTKRCSKCGEVKSINEFSEGKNYKDKLRTWCKDCADKYHKEWIKNNRGKTREVTTRDDLITDQFIPDGARVTVIKLPLLKPRVIKLNE